MKEKEYIILIRYLGKYIAKKKKRKKGNQCEKKIIAKECTMLAPPFVYISHPLRPLSRRSPILDTSYSNFFVGSAFVNISSRLSLDRTC